MLRPMHISKPLKQRLVLDHPSNKPSFQYPPLNVTPLISSTVYQEHNQNIRSEMSEMKPIKDLSRSQTKYFTTSLPKNGVRFSQQITKTKTRVRIKTQSRPSQKKEQAIKMINIFLGILAENQVFLTPDPEKVLIKHETLKNVLEYIVTSFVSNNVENFTHLSSIFRENNLNPFLESNRILKDQLPTKNKLRLVSGRIQIRYPQKEKITNPILLKNQIAELESKVQFLKEHKAELQKEIRSAVQQLDEVKRQFISLSNQIEEFSAENAKIETQLNENKSYLQKLSGLRQEIQEFALKNQNPIVKESAENYKNLECEMFKLTDLVSHSGNGKKDFQKSLTMWDIEKRMEPELKMFNKFLIQNTHFTYEEKCKELKDFLAKINGQYLKIYEELVHVIQQKTKYIKSFAEYIELWQQSYLEKCEFLGKLRQNFGHHCLKIEKVKQEYSSQMDGLQREVVCQKVLLEVEEIINLFKLGNYFY